MNEEYLIICVQEHECLYDLQNKDYDNNLVREIIWQDIANRLHVTPEECKTKWTLLRSYYRRALNRRKTVSGQTAKKIKKWRFEDQMEFLKPHFQERETQNNLDAQEETDDEAESIDIQCSPPLTPSPTPALKKQQKAVNNDSSEPSGLTGALTNFISSRSQPQTSANQDTIPSPKKKLMTFFEDISESMLKLSELDQAEIKSDIFNLVNKREIDLLRAKERVLTPVSSLSSSSQHSQNWMQRTSQQLLNPAHSHSPDFVKLEPNN